MAEMAGKLCEQSEKSRGSLLRFCYDVQFIPVSQVSCLPRYRDAGHALHMLGSEDVATFSTHLQRMQERAAPIGSTAL